jgi:hypothetical protein
MVRSESGQSGRHDTTARIRRGLVASFLATAAVFGVAWRGLSTEGCDGGSCIAYVLLFPVGIVVGLLVFILVWVVDRFR